MAKKCIICEDGAEFKIKDSSEYYCAECASEHFADLTLLQKVEAEALALKDAISENGKLSNNQDRED